MRIILFIIILFVSLMGCGYHLRGPIALAPPFKTIYLQSAAPYGQLAHELSLFFKISGSHLTETPQEAETTLVVLNEQTSNQLIGVNGTQEVRQYNLVLTVSFQLNNAQGQTILGPQTVTETRALTIKNGQILAGSNEANVLYQQMRQAIVYDILNRLSSRYVTDKLTGRAAPP